jgi:hypothetical protein
MNWMTRVQSPAGAKGFSSNLFAPTSSGAYSASDPVDPRGSFAGGVKHGWGVTDHSPPTSDKVKNE